jgi:hypothetical protein
MREQCIKAKIANCAARAIHADERMHGNYCGKGQKRGPNGELYYYAPFDELDEACRDHDKCYDAKPSNDCSCDKKLAARATTLAGSSRKVSQSAREKAPAVAAAFGAKASWCELVKVRAKLPVINIPTPPLPGLPVPQ